MKIYCGLKTFEKLFDYISKLAKQTQWIVTEHKNKLTDI